MNTGREQLTDTPAAEARGIGLAVVRLSEVKKGFILLPRRWVVERSFAWATRFGRLAKGYERLPEPVAGWHVGAFARHLSQAHDTLWPGATANGPVPSTANRLTPNPKAGTEPRHYGEGSIVRYAKRLMKTGRSSVLVASSQA